MRIAGGPLQADPLTGAPTQPGMGPQHAFYWPGISQKAGVALNRDIDWALKQTAPPSCKHVLLVLANRCDPNHSCFPSLARISGDTGLDRSTVTRCITQLLHLGLLRRTKRGIESNLYTLMIGAPRHQRQAHSATTEHPSVGAPRLTGSGSMQLPVGAPCATEPKVEPKVNPKQGELRKRTRAPDSIPITDLMRGWASKNHVTVNLDSETETMLDYHRGKGNLQADWIATWRTWMRNSIRFAKPVSSNGNGSTHYTAEQIAEATEKLRKQGTLI